MANFSKVLGERKTSHLERADVVPHVDRPGVARVRAVLASSTIASPELTLWSLAAVSISSHCWPRSARFPPAGGNWPPTKGHALGKLPLGNSASGLNPTDALRIASITAGEKLPPGRSPSPERVVFHVVRRGRWHAPGIQIRGLRRLRLAPLRQAANRFAS
jgi:hypothetical protein